MRTTAIFVDSGYLYAQGSSLITGKRQKRHAISVNPNSALHHLFRVTHSFVDYKTYILRVYWYDGAIPGQWSDEHRKIAEANFFKLRTGLLNNAGKQKGVDSLIITDLVELARNRAITDAVLLAGDEDLRIGVSIAQSLGVRIHLVGIEPSRVTQSEWLRMEADTCSEWNRDTVSAILEIDQAKLGVNALGSAARSGKDDLDADLRRMVDDVINDLGGVSFLDSKWVQETKQGAIPIDIDRPVFGKLKARLGRELDPIQKRAVRRIVSSLFLK